MEKARSKRDPKKEQYWRNAVERWRKSGLSQMQYCREEGLNHHTFSSWLYIIRDRDNKKLPKPREARVTKVKSAVPTFTRIEIDEPGSPASVVLTQDQDGMRSAVAAELINAETGCKLRIFSGADQATLAAVLSVWAGR